MATVEVDFFYHTGVTQPLFRNVRLCGSWDQGGMPSDTWSSIPMTEGLGDDGCPVFHARVGFPDSLIGRELSWGVVLDGPWGRDMWGVPTEINDPIATDRVRRFVLASGSGSGSGSASGSATGTGRPVQRYWLSTSRRFGANKRLHAGIAALAAEGVENLRTGARFAVWAPNAHAVSVVFGDPAGGYIDDNGKGIVGDDIPMTRDPEDHSVWITEADDPRMADFSALVHRPYMFQILKDNGTVAYRTDLFSRCQIGRGKIDPARMEPGEVFSGRREDLDGSVSCSVVIDPERVTELFGEPQWPETRWLDESDFWAGEFDPYRPLPSRIEDLVIYELHVGGLGAGKVDEDGRPVPGDLSDAIGLLDHLVELGINAVELLPIAEYEGWASWGYGTSHYHAIEFSGGGRDQFKHFVRECHRRGIAVIMDVVYNHYDHFADRAEWAYDSDDPTRNIYYWYEGSPQDYPGPEGGYIDNVSTGWAPRFWEEYIRQWMISSAVAQALEFHVDGFRVDQTTSLHQYASLHADGSRADHANAFGAKFLRELTRTLRMVKPSIMLIAEDHSGWEAVTRPTGLGGLGFDATWYADFYHHLCGDTGRGPSYANLLTTAAIGDNRPLAMSYFAGALAETSMARITYHESHDEAGNSMFPGGHSGRTLAIAVGRAPLIGDTRRYGEARARFAAGMSMLSAGTPMFFMGEEIGATDDYRYLGFEYHKPDLKGAAHGDGADLFAFYRAIITLRRTLPALRSRSLEIVYANDADRVLAFRRAHGPEDALIVASLNDQPFLSGYEIGGIPDGDWREVFNSDAALFGGWNEGNGGGDLRASGGRIRPIVPRAGFIVLRRL